MLEASRRLGVARGTVQARLDKLTSTGVITSWGPILPPAALGYPVTAFLTLEIRQDERAGGHDRSPAPGRIPEVLEALTITGAGDVWARVVARSNTDLQRVIDPVLAYPGIVRSSTVIALATQIPYRVLPLMDVKPSHGLPLRPPPGSVARVRLVAGVDCSTQNTKVVVCDAETGEVLREGRAPHPDVTEVDAAVWWQAWEQASDGLLDGVEAAAVGGQQHGMVLVDEAGTPVRDALLWNDNRSAPQAASLLEELGGPQAWADAPAWSRWPASRSPSSAGSPRTSPRSPTGPAACCSPTTGSPTSCAAAPASRPPTAVTPPAPATGPPPRAATATTCCAPPSARASPSPAWPAPGGGRRDARRDRAGPRHRRQHGRRAGPRARARRRGGLPRHQRHRVRGRGSSRPPTPAASSPASPTPPDGSFRWCAR